MNLPSKDVLEHFRPRSQPIFVPIQRGRAAKLVAEDDEAIERNCENRGSFVESNLV